ncbi:DUF2109 family protein [Wolbachia endosymbiont of Tribolium confusum]|nr:DUF2109 family protein [Wolbachia endosymbiont of Tribolium confusum]
MTCRFNYKISKKLKYLLANYTKIIAAACLFIFSTFSQNALVSTLL